MATANKARVARRPLRKGPPAVQREAAETRAAILQAAMREFAEEGIAGARMEAIADAAGVNKALLHYYFDDKERLYGEALDHVFATLSRRVLQVLERDLPPREKIMAYAGAHFDFIAASPIYPRLVQREMMRAGRHGSPHMRRIGQFRQVDAENFVVSLIAMNVFYFSSAPMMAIVSRRNPLTAQRIADRKAAVMDVVAATLFPSGAAAAKDAGPARRASK